MKIKIPKINFFSALTIVSLLSISFFYGIGRDRYIVRSEFAVRKSGPSSLDSGISSLFGGLNKSSLEDAGYLMVFLKSIDVLNDLNEYLNFNEVYLKKGPDIFAGLSKKHSIEDKYELFKKNILLNLNIDTGILTIKTISFDPESAFIFNKFLLKKAEKFINTINASINKKQLNFAKIEKLKSEKRVNNARNALIDFQEKNQLFDVNSEVRTSNNLIGSLEIELSKKKVELATNKRKFIDPNAPEIIYLEDQVDELKKQISKERLLVVSPRGKALNKKSAELEKLNSELNLAISLYESTQSAIEQTRVDSIRQQRFIAMMSNPIYPEKEWNFWRLKGFLTTLLIYLIGYVLTKFILGMSQNKIG